MIKSATGTELVGNIFAFDFKKAQLSRSDVKSAMTDNRLDDKELPNLSSRSDFGRAIRQYKREHTDGNSSLTFVSSDKQFMYFQFNREAIQENAITDAGTNDNVWIKEKDISPYIKVVYDIAANRIIVNDDYADAEEVKSALYRLLKVKEDEYNKSEVSSAIIRNLIKFGNAVSIIRGQKVFFVPAKSEGLLNRVESALKAIDPDVFISRWEAPREERVVQSVTQSVVEKMQIFNDSYQKQIEEFVDKSKNMSATSVRNKMDEIAGNIKFLESYRDILGEQTDKLLKNLDATKAMLEQFNTTGDVVNPYREIYNKIKAKHFEPDVEKEWFEAAEIPDDVLALLEDEYVDVK
jgi:hypothetical protein